MGDPMVISDGSEPEENFDSVVSRPPEVLDISEHPPENQGPRASTSATSVTEQSSAQNPRCSRQVTATSQVSLESDLLHNLGVNPEPRVRRPVEVIDLTGDSEDEVVTDLTETDENPSKIRRVEGSSRRSVNVAQGGSGSGFVVEAVSTIPEKNPGASVPPDEEPGSSQIPQGFFFPISDYGSAHDSPGQCSSTTFTPASEATAVSSASTSPVTTVPRALSEFYQLSYDSSEEGENDDQNPEPIRPVRLQVVINTIEANFPEATVQSLDQFVTPRYYPPRGILAHVIRKILLAPNVGTLLNDTFKLLARIQELHPATVNQVAWDWELLIFVMQTQDRELPGHIFFLRYVLMTLNDDFQEVLKLPDDQMRDTIASTVLSCDRQPENIKDIIRWLTEILTDSAFPPLNIFPVTGPPPNLDEVLSLHPFTKDKGNQLIVLYMQKMLAMAVEVDKSPNRTCSQIAELLFGHILTINERNQREVFFTSIENHLLRCKVLETILLHSCKTPTSLPLSFAQILYFLNNATSPYAQTNDTSWDSWDSWDELVEQLQFLLISYNKVLTNRLSIPIKERQDLGRTVQPPMQHGDDITALDIELQIEGFRGRMVQVVGGTMPLQLQEKLCLFKLLFLQAIHGKPLSGSRFQSGHLLKARNLLAQEFPTQE